MRPGKNLNWSINFHIAAVLIFNVVVKIQFISLIGKFIILLITASAILQNEKQTKGHKIVDIAGITSAQKINWRISRIMEITFSNFSDTYGVLSWGFKVDSDFKQQVVSSL